MNSFLHFLVLISISYIDGSVTFFSTRKLYFCIHHEGLKTLGLHQYISVATTLLALQLSLQCATTRQRHLLVTFLTIMIMRMINKVIPDFAHNIIASIIFIIVFRLLFHLKSCHPITYATLYNTKFHLSLRHYVHYRLKT